MKQGNHEKRPKIGHHEKTAPKYEVEDIALTIHRLRALRLKNLASQRDLERVLDWAEEWVEFARPRPLPPLPERRAR